MEKPKSIYFKDIIVFEDDNLLFINKPAGYSSLDDRHSDTLSILRLAKKHDAELQLCHRLDKDTSGIMVLAKNPEAYREMAMLFEKREVNKTYHAIINGNLNVENLEINLPISPTNKGIAKIDRKEGKQSLTIVNSLKNYRHYTLLACKPVTGRLHQIRIHLASQNFPLVADETYGGKFAYLSQFKRNFNTAKYQNEEPIIKRFCLHAYQLQFIVLEKNYEVIAPYPKDFAVFLKQLDKFDL